MGLGVQVGIGQSPLASSGEPDAPGRQEGLDEGVGVGNLRVVGVEDGDVLRARALEGAAAREVLVVALPPASRGMMTIGADGPPASSTNRRRRPGR